MIEHNPGAIESIAPDTAMSPVPSSNRDELQNKVLVDFYTAVRAVAEDGKRITRIEWSDSDIYGFMKGEVLHIKRTVPGSQFSDHKWIVNLGDMIAEDWIILD